jgi:hypothetical protein
MLMDTFPILPADAMAVSMLCRNSLTVRQVQLAQRGLRHLSPSWTVACCESCEADLFLDVSRAQPNGHDVSFIIHAQDDAVHVLRMTDDVDTTLGHFDGMAQAVRVVLEAIETDTA